MKWGVPRPWGLKLLSALAVHPGVALRIHVSIIPLFTLNTTGSQNYFLVYNVITVKKETPMKRLLLIAALLSTPAFAGGQHSHHHRGGGVWPWIGGAVVGAIIYEAARPAPQPVIVYGQPRWAPQQPVIIYHNMSGSMYWTPPAYTAQGQAYCPPGLYLYVKQQPNGSLDNVGCAQ